MDTYRSGKRITLQDIAKKTGYSVNTVSHALRNKEDISRETSEKIRQAARELGYMGNQLASSLRSGETKTLALILGNMSNPFYSIMTDIIQAKAAEQGYRLLIMCSLEHAALELELVEAAAVRRADGILLFPTGRSQPTLDRLCQLNIPCVLISRSLEDSRISSVVSDGEQGAYLATRHLIEHGRKNLAFLSRQRIVYSYENRLHGFERACREANLPAERTHTFYCAVSTELNSYQYDWQTPMTETLKQWRIQGVDGIFVFCDVEAWHVQFLLQHTPELQDWDVGLVGFDNIQGIQHYPGSLCSVDCGFDGMVTKALEMLLCQIRGEDLQPRKIVCPVSLICRGSC